MNLMKNVIFFLACLCCFHQGLPASTELDFSDSTLMPIDLEQVVITEDGFFIIDETNTTIQVHGFFQQDHQMYALTSMLLEKYKGAGPARCGHSLVCDICQGCGESGCFKECKCGSKRKQYNWQKWAP